MKEIWIIGIGCFGLLAAERLAKIQAMRIFSVRMTVMNRQISVL